MRNDNHKILWETYQQENITLDYGFARTLYTDKQFLLEICRVIFTETETKSNTETTLEKLMRNSHRLGI